MSQRHEFSSVDELLESFVREFGNDDPDGLVAFFAEGSIAVGTGAEEVSFGLDAIRSETARDVSRTDTISMSTANESIDVVGDAGFVYAEATFTGLTDGEAFEVSTRLTLGLVKDASSWRIMQLHLSEPGSE